MKKISKGVFLSMVSIPERVLEALKRVFSVVGVAQGVFQSLKGF